MASGCRRREGAGAGVGWSDGVVWSDGVGWGDGVRGLGGSDFVVEVVEELVGGGEGLCGGGAGCAEFIGVQVVEARAKDGLQAGSGIGADRLQVGQAGGVVDERHE